MEPKNLKNASTKLQEKRNKNSNNKNNIGSLDTPIKIYEYQNRVHMMQRRINQRVKEEQKNIEKQLSNFSTSFHNLTSRNFYRDYQKFSEKYFKTTNLIEDIAQKYEEKNYKIPNLNHDFFKANPLLDCNMNKLFISYLFNSNGEKIDVNKMYKSNKGIKYITKLKNFISPEKSEDNIDNEIKNEKKSKNIKMKILLKKKRKNNFPRIKSKSLMNNNLQNKIDISKKNKTSRNITIYKYKGILNGKLNKLNNTGSFNKNNKINLSKSRNSSSSSKPLERRENRYKSHRFNINEKDKLFLNIPNNKSKTRNSMNNLKMFNTTYNIHINKFSQKDNHIYLNTEKISTNKTSECILETPKNKIQISSSNQNKSTNNTKSYSIINNEKIPSSSLSSKKISSYKSKNTLISLKIKDFSLNSKNNKNSKLIKDKKLNQTSTKIISYNKKGRKSYTYRSKKNIKFENIIKGATISLSGAKKINLSESKEESIEHIYKSLKAGKYENMEYKIKNYLLNIKKADNDEVNSIIDKYQYKNLRTNFNEMKTCINNQNLGKKIEKLYLNNHDYNRIEPLMNKLKIKEKEIFQFENKISKIYNK